MNLPQVTCAGPRSAGPDPVSHIRNYPTTMVRMLDAHFRYVERDAAKGNLYTQARVLLEWVRRWELAEDCDWKEGRG